MTLRIATQDQIKARRIWIRLDNAMNQLEEANTLLAKYKNALTSEEQKKLDLVWDDLSMIKQSVEERIFK